MQTLSEVKKILKTEEIQVPHGFTDDDINLKASRLFSDNFSLYYVKNMLSLSLTSLATALPSIYHKELLSFVTGNLTKTIELHNDTGKLLLEKGLPVRPPFVSYPTEIEFVQKQSFLLDMMNKRPLLAREVNTLHINMLTNAIGTCISAGFAQVSNSKEVCEYFSRGKEISKKHVSVFSDYLENQSLPISLPLASNQDVTNSGESPFSDKLMMYHFLVMNSAGVSNYGVAISSSMRSDLVVDFTRLMTEILKFSEDGANIMIKNSWFERPPLSTYRVQG